LVCALAAVTATLYGYVVFHFPFLMVVVGGMLLVVLFSGLGLVWPRYFGLYFIPLFNALANDIGHEHSGGGFPWKIGIASTSLLLGLIALVIGAVFQLHVVFAMGALLVDLGAANFWNGPTRRIERRANLSSDAPEKHPAVPQPRRHRFDTSCHRFDGEFTRRKSSLE
jgi:hypothetical protein